MCTESVVRKLVCLLAGGWVECVREGTGIAGNGRFDLDFLLDGRHWH